MNIRSKNSTYTWYIVNSLVDSSDNNISINTYPIRIISFLCIKTTLKKRWVKGSQVLENCINCILVIAAGPIGSVVMYSVPLHFIMWVGVFRCCCRAPFVAKFLSHGRHVKGLSVACRPFMCFVRWSFRPNDFVCKRKKNIIYMIIIVYNMNIIAVIMIVLTRSQMLHLYGRWELCRWRTCLRIVYECSVEYVQRRHM